MIFTTVAISQLTTNIECISQQRFITVCCLVALNGFLGYFIEANPFYRCSGTGEVLFNKCTGKADCIENLCTAIRLIGRNSHFRHHLQYAFIDCFDITVMDFLHTQLAVQLGQHVGDTVECQVGIDCLSTVSGQQAEIMHLASLAGLHDNTDIGTQAVTDKVVMYRSSRQQCRNSNRIGIHGSIRQDKNIESSLFNQFTGLFTQSVDGCLHTGGSFACGIHHIQRIGPEGTMLKILNTANLFKVNAGQNWLVNLQTFVLSASLQIQQVRSRTNQRDQ